MAYDDGGHYATAGPACGRCDHGRAFHPDDADGCQYMHGIFAGDPGERFTICHCPGYVTAEQLRENIVTAARIYDVPPWLVGAGSTGNARPRFARARWILRRVFPWLVWR